jgi:hypothetical protein
MPDQTARRDLRQRVVNSAGTIPSHLLRRHLIHAGVSPDGTTRAQTPHRIRRRDDLISARAMSTPAGRRRLIQGVVSPGAAFSSQAPRRRSRRNDVDSDAASGLESGCRRSRRGDLSPDRTMSIQTGRLRLRWDDAGSAAEIQREKIRESGSSNPGSSGVVSTSPAESSATRWRPSPVRRKTRRRSREGSKIQYSRTPKRP